MLLSAVAFVSIAVDRTIRSTPAHAGLAPVSAPGAAVAPATERVKELLTVGAPTPAPRPVAGTADPVRRAVGAKTSVQLDLVPAPPTLPPLTEEAVYVRPAPPKVIAAARPQDVRAAVVEQPAPSVAPEPVPERVTNYSEADDKAPANPAVRAIRSVGRVLGIGRKEK
jgi:hypothetical protein